jgi:PleD family two-component response regulator
MVDQHQGQLTFETEMGVGSVFIIRLPLNPLRSGPAKKGAAMKRILFVDDEPLILEAMERMLSHLRHEWDMRFAGSGAEALQSCWRNRRRTWSSPTCACRT